MYWLFICLIASNYVVVDPDQKQEFLINVQQNNENNLKKYMNILNIFESIKNKESITNVIGNRNYDNFLFIASEFCDMGV